MVRRTIAYPLISIFFIISTPCYSAGFAVQEQSVSGLGSAFAGYAATAEDASTVYGNPAGLTYIKERQIVGGLHLILPSAEFSDDGSTYYSGDPITGKEDSSDAIGVVPNAYIVHPLNEQFTLGFGVNAPYGMTTEYDVDWIGRYHATTSMLKVINFNPTVGMKLNEEWSMGVGISAYYGGVQLESQVDFGGAFGEATIGQHDVAADFGGSGWGYGAQLGFIYEPNEVVRVGLNIRSSAWLTFEGEVDFDVPSGLPDFMAVAAATQFADGDIEASTRLPENASLSVVYNVSPTWDILGDASYTRWSRFNELRIKYDDGRADTVQPENWKNAWRFAGGFRYQHSASWLIRAGMAIEQTPVPDAQLRTARIPDDNRTWLTLGLNKVFSPSLSMDVAYGAVFAGSTAIDNDDEISGHNLKGEYESVVHILSAQLNWRY